MKDSRVVAAYPYGSKTIENSLSVFQYIQRAKRMGVEIVSSITELLEKGGLCHVGN